MRHEQLSVSELTASTVTAGTVITAGYKLVYSGVSAVENDADASVAVTVTGVLATDVAVASLVAAATAQSIAKTACTANTVTVTLAGNGGVGTQVFYQVYRAA